MNSKSKKQRREFSSNEEREEFYLKKQQVNEFHKSLNKYLMTTRFNNFTFGENKKYREKIKTNGCIYGSPDQIASSIAIDTIMFILEMNNDENRIEGIGMIKNHPIIGKHNIYSVGNYNRYVYLGKYRIDRSQMTELEESVMKALDILCFTGTSHMKRGQGLKQFPIHLIYNCLSVINLVEFIKNMFKTRYFQKDKEKENEKSEEKEKEK